MIIGKYALESITTGMYVNPLDVLREYIQNAADAIDSAVDGGYLTRKDARILISLDTLQRSLCVEDNGSGIATERALAVLTDIGNSEKQHTQNRGFRGIGRLSGLSYSDTLTFRTSSIGEAMGVEVIFNAKKLRELLAQNDASNLSAETVVETICSIKRFQSSESSHFFIVQLDGVSLDSGLLDEEHIYEYLSQNAPIEYDSNKFSWAAVISQEIPVHTYRVCLKTSHGIRNIVKPYADTLLINRTTGETDQINDIHFLNLTDGEGCSIGIAWYSVSSFKGSIVDKSIKGLRLRVGNIMIGDGQSLNHIFKDSRFNGWIAGEVFLDSSDLIPNARRDDFEHNGAYYRLMEQLRALAVDITQRIRSASVSRNKALDVALRKVEQVSAEVLEELGTPVISSTTKGKLTIQVSSVRKELGELHVKPSEANLRNEALEKLDILTGRIKGATQFRAINLIPGLSTTEKGMLARIFRNLMEHYPQEEAQKCIDMILSTYSET